MRIGLGKIAPQRSRPGENVFRQQTRRIADGKRVLEDLPRLVAPSGEGEGVGVPERADQKSRLRMAEIVGLVIAHDKAVAHEAPGDDVERFVHARIVRWQEADLRQEQAGRIRDRCIEDAG